MSKWKMKHIIEYDSEYEVYNVIDTRDKSIVCSLVYEAEAVATAQDLDAKLESESAK